MARIRSPESEDHGLLVEVVDCDGVRHQWPMPMATLAGSGEAALSKLLEMGWRPNPTALPRQWKGAVPEYLATADPAARARVVTAIGWHGELFVLPDQAFGAGASAEPVILGPGAAQDHAFRQAGTLAEWQAQVSRPARGNSRLMLALCAAFMGPVLAMVGEDGVGFHFRGASSIGKSTALYIAGSVWGGGGVKGYVQTWRATDNALESTCLMHDRALLCLDELAQVDAKAAGQAAYMLANGKGKARAGKDGTARRALTWRLVFLSSGEITLADKIREGGGQAAAGMEVRVIDLRADAGAGLGLFEDLHDATSAQEAARALREAAGRVYGTASRAFLSALVRDVPGHRERVADLRADFLKDLVPEGADGQVKRVAGYFALVAAAGELATALGVTGWEAGEATTAAHRCFASWIEERGGVGSGELMQAKRRLRNLILADGQARFLPWRRDVRTVIRTKSVGYVDRAAEVEGEEAKAPVYYLTATGMDEVLQGMDRASTLEALAKAGALLTLTPDGKTVSQRLTKPFKVPSEGRQVIRLYRLDLVALGVAEALPDA